MIKRYEYKTSYLPQKKAWKMSNLSSSAFKKPLKVKEAIEIQRNLAPPPDFLGPVWVAIVTITFRSASYKPAGG